MDILKFEYLKNIVIIARKNDKDKKYYNMDDINFFNTDTSKVYGIQHQDLIFIKDNCKFNAETNADYKIKVYDTKNKKISTCFISKNEDLINNIIETIEYMRCFSDKEVEIIMTGDIYLENNHIGIHSEYLKKGIYLI